MTEWTIDSIQFGLLDPSELKRYAVREITSTSLYRHSLPEDDGLNSLSMGTSDQRLRCKTCRHSVRNCPGHFGYIDLAHACYHPCMLDVTLKFLRSCCFWCSALLNDGTAPRRKLRPVKILSLMSSAHGKPCPVCEGPQPSYSKSGMYIDLSWGDTDFESDEEREIARKPFSAEVAHRILTDITDEDAEQCGVLNVGFSRPENCILKRLVVSPPVIRPSVQVQVGSQMRGQGDLTIKLLDILKSNTQYKDALEKGKDPGKFLDALQLSICLMMDKDVRPFAVRMAQKGGPPRSSLLTRSLTDRLGGKGGRLRNNCMGKRVNFSSRSVITAGQGLDVDQVGVPQFVAKTQYVPERVTRYNLAELQERVLRGPSHLEGAHSIVDKYGRRRNLAMCGDDPKTRAIHIGDVVNRTLRDGDWVVFNRQPSLRPESMLGHRALIHKDPSIKSFFLPVLDTPPYNADFDGDEMNLHTAGRDSRAEIKHLMGVNRNLVSPQKNQPVIAYVQDTLLGVFRLTHMSTFITPEHFVSILRKGAHYLSKPYPEPAIRWRNSSANSSANSSRWRQAYTGKQLFSMLCPCIHLERRCRGLDDRTFLDARERLVVIRRGQLLCGQLCKATMGSSQGGVVHVTCLDLSNEKASHFLSDSSRVVAEWFQEHGFSVGIADIWVDQATHDHVTSIVDESLAHLDDMTARARGRVAPKLLENYTNNVLGKVLRFAGQTVIRTLDFRNALFCMSKGCGSGSKGSKLNAAQIGGCIGQQNVGGNRILPRGRRSLPCYPLGDESPLACGFCANSYAVGITPQEFFFHAMGGREGLVSTAVKTALTGYIQRRLIKMMEGLCVRYDQTVRTSQGQMLQGKYGNDGWDARWLERVRVPCLLGDDADVRSSVRDPALAEMVLGLRDTVRRSKLHFNPELNPCVYVPVNVERTVRNVLGNAAAGLEPADLLTEPPVAITLETLRPILDWIVAVNGDEATRCQRLVVTSVLGAREDLSALMLEHVLVRIRRTVLRAIVSPGTMVGAIAACSIGEPCTQMTLDTFHHSGMKEKDMSLGVPRFKELIDVSKAPKTPSVDVYLDVSAGSDLAAAVARSLEEVFLGSLVTGTRIIELPDGEPVPNDQDLTRLMGVARDIRSRPPKDPSRFLAILSVAREPCENQGMTPFDVAASVEAYFDGSVECVGSESADGTRWCVAVRILGIKAIMQVKKLGDGVAPEELVRLERTSVQQIIEGSMDRVRLKGVPGISRTFVTPHRRSVINANTGSHSVSEELVVETSGTNLETLLGVDGVDTVRTISNDVHEVYRVLGISAAQHVLFQELIRVLTFDGNRIDERHVFLLASTMCRGGFVCPVSRHGMSKSRLPTLPRAAFEETKGVFTAASVFGVADAVDGVSEAIMFGKQAPIGTGAFTVMPRDPETDHLRPGDLSDNDDSDNSDAETPVFVGVKRRREEAAPPPRMSTAPKWKRDMTTRTEGLRRRWDPRKDPRTDAHLFAVPDRPSTPPVPDAWGSGGWGQDDFWSSIQEDPQQSCRPVSSNYPPSPVTGWETHSPVADMDEKPVSSASSSVAPIPSAAMVMSRGAFEFDNAGASAWPARTSSAVGKATSSAARRTYVPMSPPRRVVYVPLSPDKK